MAGEDLLIAILEALKAGESTPNDIQLSWKTNFIPHEPKEFKPLGNLCYRTKISSQCQIKITMQG